MTHMLMTHMRQNQLMVSKHSSQRPLPFATSKNMGAIFCTTAAYRNPFLVNGAPLEQGATVVIRENDMLTLSDPPIAVLRVHLRFLEAKVDLLMDVHGVSMMDFYGNSHVFADVLYAAFLCFICDVIGSSCISVADSKGEDLWCQCRHVAMLSRIVIQDSYPLISMIVLVLSCWTHFTSYITIFSYYIWMKLCKISCRLGPCTKAFC